MYVTNAMYTSWVGLGDETINGKPSVCGAFNIVCVGGIHDLALIIGWGLCCGFENCFVCVCMCVCPCS